jgi:hypothetical protein
MTSRPTTRSAAAEATVKDESLSETVKETVKEVAEAFTRQGLSGNSMPPIFTGETDAIDWLGIFERYARAGGWDDTTCNRRSSVLDLDGSRLVDGFLFSERHSRCSRRREHR